MENNLRALLENTHFRYISIITLLICGGILSVTIGETPKLFEYVNAGVAITSLTLSIFAIWMTATSTQKNDSNISKLQDAINESKINSQTMTQSTLELNKGLENIREIIQLIPEKVDESASAIKELSNTMQSNMIGDTNNTLPVSIKKPENAQFSPEYFERFFKICSVTGSLTAYALCKFAEKSEFFNWNKFSEADANFNARYIRGFMVGLIASGIFLKKEATPNGMLVENVNNINPDNILSIVRQTVSDLEKKKKSDDNRTSEKLEELILIVNLYIENHLKNR